MSHDLRSLRIKLWQLLDIRPAEASRIGLMAGFLFFLLAANNVIKVLRDALFLSRFPITELPYVYLLVAVVAGLVISVYARYITQLSFSRVILGSLIFIISNVIIFWLLIVFYDLGWVLYAFYVWSAIVSLIVVAQFWTMANDLFTSREGKRLFGVLAAGGTLGGMMGGLGANWAVNFVFGTDQLLWLTVGLLLGAFGMASLAVNESKRLLAPSRRENVRGSEIKTMNASGVVGVLLGSRYLQSMAGLIFVSVIVSTLIDFQFKAVAKEAYPSKDALAGFFGSYYAWLSVVTIVAQVWLTGKLLVAAGLTPSLLLLPLTLLGGSVGLLIWPGLFAATATRLAEASLRTSVNRSGMEILYLPISAFIRNKVKVFLDVIVERLGDGTAALIILFYMQFLEGADVTLLSYFSIGFIFIWAAVVFVVQGGYIEALRRSLAYREISLEGASIDFADKGTVEAVLKTLEEKDERTVLFGMDLAEKLDPKIVVARLPMALLRHPSVTVRSRAIRLFALRPDRNILEEIKRMLEDENKEVQAEAISTATAIFRESSIPLVRPYGDNPDPQIRSRALECLLRYGDAADREAALNSVARMLNNDTPDGEALRVDAIRLMGEISNPAFPSHLSRLIKNDQSFRVIRGAMAAAGKRKYPGVVKDIIFRLC